MQEKTLLHFNRNPFRKFFSLLSTEHSKMLLESSFLLKYNKGESLIKQDQKIKYFSIIHKGYAKVWQNGNPHPEILTIIPQQNLFLLAFLFFETIAPVNATAIEKCEVICIESQAFTNACKQNAEFGFEVFSMINMSLRRFYLTRSLKFFRKNMHARFAQVLVHLSCETFQSTEFNVSLRRDELAQLVGISRENVIKVISDLRRENILSVTGKHFKILNITALIKIAAIG